MIGLIIQFNFKHENHKMFSQVMVKNFIIDAGTLISDLLDAYPKTAEVFINKKMVCVGCEAEEFHTLKDAAQYYNIEIKSLIEEIKKLAKE